MNTEINRIYELLQVTFSGEPWHGSSVMHILAGVSAEQARIKVVPYIHNIWELVLHMIAWRKFTWQKLSGNASYDISTTEQEWPIVLYTDGQAWQQTIYDLEQSQQALLKIISRFDDGVLDQVVPGREYTFYVLLQGIIQHDLYHSGQIALLKKQLF